MREESRALRRALVAAEDAGVRTEVLEVRELDLPMYEPGRLLEKLGRLVERLSPVREAGLAG